MKPVLTAPLLIVTSIGDTVMRHILTATLLAMAYQRKARKDQYSNTTVKKQNYLIKQSNTLI